MTVETSETHHVLSEKDRRDSSPSFSTSSTFRPSEGNSPYMSDDEDSPRRSDEHAGLLEEKLPIENEGADVEAQQSAAPPPAKKPSRLLFWILVNILATIGIVFINKTIFEDEALRKCQLSFAAFHFFITFCTLQVCSTRRFSMFERKFSSVKSVLPIALAMCLNVILPNLSLAYSSVTFYQTARILLTPVTALINYLIYHMSITRQAASTLIPICLGVGMLTYSDVGRGADSKATTPVGVFFALSGVLASSLYTIWISRFRTKLEMTSIQLLHQQALVGAVMLLYAVPWIDKFPVWSTVSSTKWILIGLSGGCACLINLSQFVIIAGAGPVSSTVVGHTKTVCIVTLGWIVTGRSANAGAILGVFTAIGGVILYSVATLKANGQGK